MIMPLPGRVVTNGAVGRKPDYTGWKFAAGDTVFLKGGVYDDPQYPDGYECTIVADKGTKVSLVCKFDNETYDEPKTRICNAVGGKLDYSVWKYDPGDTVFLKGGVYDDPQYPDGYECTIVADKGTKVSLVCKFDNETYDEPKTRICNVVRRKAGKSSGGAPTQPSASALVSVARSAPAPAPAPARDAWSMLNLDAGPVSLAVTATALASIPAKPAEAPPVSVSVTHSAKPAPASGPKIDYSGWEFSVGDTVFLKGGVWDDPLYPDGYECTILVDKGERVSVICKYDNETYNEPKSRICNAVCAPQLGPLDTVVWPPDPDRERVLYALAMTPSCGTDRLRLPKPEPKT